ncbi:MAG: hypothetical protein RIS70_956 [Planctomycetota bacterium]
MHSTQNRAGGISLRQLLPEARIFGSHDIEFRSCCSSPDDCQPGDLFVAICGAEDDSHDWATTAVENGAVAVVVERYLPVRVPQCLVGDSRVAYGIICQALAGDPTSQMRTIGVTGSNGKTVTSMLIASILGGDAAERAQNLVGAISSVGCSDGVRQSESSRTTPVQPELADWLRRMVSNHCRHAVLEVSSKAMADRRLAGVQLDAYVLTNLRRDHLPEHHSMANYRRLKLSLLKQLKPEGFAILNADDPFTADLLPQLAQPALTYGINSEADLTATIVERHASEQTFILHAGQESIPVRTQMIGDHHVSNCLAAAAVALVLGHDLASIARGLERVEYVPGRLEMLRCGQPYSVYVDGAQSPDAVTAALRTVRRVTTGRVICVCGAEGTSDSVRRAELGMALERNSQQLVLTNDNPGEQEPLQIMHDLLDGIAKPAKVQIIPDRETAIAWALRNARRGDSVVILGKGDRDFQLVGRKRLKWSDRDMTRTLLYQQGATTAQPPVRSTSHLRIVG